MFKDKRVMNCYDFDKTIYKKDSSIELLKYAMKKNFLVFFYVFKICIFTILYYCKFIKIEKFKEVYFGFLKFFDDKDKFIESFWSREEKNINQWYINQKDVNDVVCSASPLFLVKSIMDKINPSCKVYATQLDINTFKVSGKNLKGENKRLCLV